MMMAESLGQGITSVPGHSHQLSCLFWTGILWEVNISDKLGCPRREEWNEKICALVTEVDSSGEPTVRREEESTGHCSYI